MIVLGDIQNAINRVAAVSDPTVQLEYVNRAVKNLANYAPSTGAKPIWDPLQVYVNLPTQSPANNLVILPYEIEKPVKVNINNDPTFSRTQLYEFSLNGPGSSMVEAGWQWQDRGYVCYQAFWATPSTLTIVSDAGSSDSGVVISALIKIADPSGLSSSGYIEQEVIWTLGTMGSLTTTQTVVDIMAISKPATVGNITLTTVTGSIKIAYYPAAMTRPRYGLIKISQPGYAVRMLARRKHSSVSLATDFIPLDNEQSVILMVAAIFNYENGNVPQGQALEATAFAMLDREQKSRNAFDMLASMAEVQTAQNLNIITRDVIQVNDIYDEFCTIVGPIGQQKVFDRLTRTVELLANLSHWDPLIGYMDYQLGPPPFYVTLPREVDQVIALNVNGRPGTFRSRWFEFSFGGQGQAESANLNTVWRSTEGWEEWGEVCTAYDPIQPNYAPMAWNFNAADAGVQITIYGTDVNGNRLMTNGVSGITLTAGQNYSTAAFGMPHVATIIRITKPVTQGFIGLLLTDGVQNVQTLGTYYPDDIEPIYRRIKVGTANLGTSTTSPFATINGNIISTPVVRFRFRKRWRNFTKMTDIIPLKSATAINLMAQYENLMTSGQLNMMNAAAAQQMKAEAIDAVNKQWRAANPQEQVGLNIDRHTQGFNFRSII